MFIKPDQTVEGAMAGYKKMRVEYFTRALQKSNLEKFKKLHQNKYEIKEVKPPRDGVAYSCAYKFLHHTDTSFCADIEQYWDKNGNCIGFMLDGVKYMFNKENLLEQGRHNDAQRFRDGQICVDAIESFKIPENSELAKYLEQYPDAKVKPSRLGWVTELPEDKYSRQMIIAQRVKIWSKDGKFLPMIKSAQKEM